MHAVPRNVPRGNLGTGPMRPPTTWCAVEGLGEACAAGISGPGDQHMPQLRHLLSPSVAVPKPRVRWMIIFYGVFIDEEGDGFADWAKKINSIGCRDHYLPLTTLVLPCAYSCQITFGRHSNSIDVTRKACGGCRGPLVYLGRFLPDGTPAKMRPPTGFSLFVKEHFARGKDEKLQYIMIIMVGFLLSTGKAMYECLFYSEKATLPSGTPHREVMRKLSARWSELGTRGAQNDASSDDVCLALQNLGLQ